MEDTSVLKFCDWERPTLIKKNDSSLEVWLLNVGEIPRVSLSTPLKMISPRTLVGLKMTLIAVSLTSPVSRS